jgi:hypothetical protein
MRGLGFTRRFDDASFFELKQRAFEPSSAAAIPAPAKIYRHAGRVYGP